MGAIEMFEFFLVSGKVGQRGMTPVPVLCS
jgi:hypothetical protein